MGTILRPIKSGGARTYVGEVAAGSTTITDTEVDGDVDTIYSEFNGNIDNANIKVGAGIATSKIAQDSGLVVGHLADNAVTLAKTASGAASANGDLQLSSTPFPGTALAGVDTTILTSASITPRGLLSVLLVDAVLIGVSSLADAQSSNITVRLKLNAVLVTDGEVNIIHANNAGGGTTSFPFTVVIPYRQTGLAGAQVYTLTAFETGTGLAVRYHASLRVVELA